MHRTLCFTIYFNDSNYIIIITVLKATKYNLYFTDEEI